MRRHRSIVKVCCLQQVTNCSQSALVEPLSKTCARSAYLDECLTRLERWGGVFPDGAILVQANNRAGAVPAFAIIDIIDLLDRRVGVDHCSDELGLIPNGIADDIGLLADREGVHPPTHGLEHNGDAGIDVALRNALPTMGPDAAIALARVSASVMLRMATRFGTERLAAPCLAEQQPARAVRWWRS